MALRCAAANGDASRVRELIDSDPQDVCAADSEDGITPLMAAAAAGHTEVVRLLLDAGAPWNALDVKGSCAGDFAMDNGHQEAYDLLLDAGVKAELVLGAAFRRANEDSTEASNKDYLDARVDFSEGKLLDEDGQGVMLAWEKPLMEAHAKAVCSSGAEGGGDILNVGFGMGLVDTAIQSYTPASHTIIEAHPDVYARMLASGWGAKPNVRILFGRWQDVLPQLGQRYDGIFFDTYGEYYEDMREFHAHLPVLLKPSGIYSFFNGMCGHNAFFHVVYCQLVALELAHLGLETQFIPLPVEKCLDDKTWKDVKQKYWQLDTYFLPVCQPEEEEQQQQQEPAAA